MTELTVTIDPAPRSSRCGRAALVVRTAVRKLIGHHQSALAGERPGHREADALARSGDQRHLVLEMQVHEQEVWVSSGPPRS
ncbi:hypothetical protein [Streptomyces vinaceus]|uniref:hypothetical protein n=1 Tax=Streptomyces vinaceus TaxID=1960 RepID=UPI0038204192